MTGLAPGADAWHALARRRHRSATRWARLVLAASKADDREEWRARAEAAEDMLDIERSAHRLTRAVLDDVNARAEAAEAEVERLRAKLAAAREAWGKRSDLSWHSAFANGAVALRYEYAVLVTAALADEAEADRRDDLEARLVRLAKVDGTVWLAVFDDDSARAWTRLTPMDSASHGPTPSAAVAALEAQLEADRG